MKPSQDASWAHWTQWSVLNNKQQQIQLRRQQSLFIKPLETAGGALPRHRSNLKGHFTLLYTLINLRQILQLSIIANYNYNCTIPPESNKVLKKKSILSIPAWRWVSPARLPRFLFAELIVTARQPTSAFSLPRRITPHHLAASH